MSEKIETVRGTGNVYRDLGEANADAKLAKSLLAARIIAVLDERGLSTRKAEAHTGVDHADFVRIRNARLQRFTIDRLVAILNKLDERVEIDVWTHPEKTEGKEKPDIDRGAPSTPSFSTVHVDYPPAFGGWILPLKARLHRCGSERLRRNLDQSEQGNLWRTALSLSATLAIANRVVSRVNGYIEALEKDLEENQDVLLDCCLHDAVYSVRDPAVVLDLVAAIDSVLFEHQAAHEKLRSFLKGFYLEILEKKLRKESLQQEMIEWGIEADWEEKLKTYRNRFIHKTTPWIAVRVESLDPLRVTLQLVINGEEYVPFEELGKIVRGFGESLLSIRRHLMEWEIPTAEWKESLDSVTEKTLRQVKVAG